MDFENMTIYEIAEEVSNICEKEEIFDITTLYYEDFEEFCEVNFNNSSFVEFAEAIKNGNFKKEHDFYYVRNGAIFGKSEEELKKQFADFLKYISDFSEGYLPF